MSKPRYILILECTGGGRDGTEPETLVYKYSTMDAAVDYLVDHGWVKQDGWQLIEVANYLEVEVRHEVGFVLPDGAYDDAVDDS